MAFLAQANLAVDANFQARVKHAIIKSAIAIKSELANTARHEARSALAHEVLRNPDVWGVLFARAVVTNEALSVASLDSDIEFTVNSMWNAFAFA